MTAEIRLIGESQAFAQALDLVSQIANLNKPVLIVGERGTGKELIAQRLHFLSPRWDQNYLKMNCAALSDSLLESELFGHESGAFTGAAKRHQGRFERADHGSLFMDEIATVSSRVQEQLLRVIEYGEFERLGGSQTLYADVRIIAATNEDLPSLVEQDNFRADLLDRLAFDVITLPPLRQRQEDIMPLANAFANNMTSELSRDFFSGFSDQAYDYLLSHNWPGNIRELKNCIERSVYRNQEWQQPITEIIINPFDSPYRPGRSSPPAATTPTIAGPTSTIAATSKPTQTPNDLKSFIADTEREVLKQALSNHHFKQKSCAQSLGLSYHQLRAYLRKYPELLDQANNI